MRFLAAGVCLVLSAACGGKSAPQGAGEPADVESGGAGGQAGPPKGSGPPAILGEEGDIPLTTLAGTSTRLKEHGARVTVVAMWATWCTPCLEELPYLEALHQKYRDREDVSVLAVNVDPDSKHAEVKSLVEELGLTLPVLLDGEPLHDRIAKGERKRLPLLAIISPAFDIHRETGFAPGIPRDDYLASKTALIDAALEGREVPASSQDQSRGLPPAGAAISLQLPAVDDPSGEQIQSMIAKLREVFNDSYPAMSDEKREELLEKIEKALQDGDRTVELQL